MGAWFSSSMDSVLRVLMPIGLGLTLIGLNYLFIQYLRQTFFANEYFITFLVIREDKADEHYTEMMARMLVAQLGSLQRRLVAARPATQPASKYLSIIVLIPSGAHSPLMLIFPQD